MALAASLALAVVGVAQVAEAARAVLGEVQVALAAVALVERVLGALLVPAVLVGLPAQVALVGPALQTVMPKKQLLLQ